MKLEERQVELIQADIDGELAGADRAELSACLLANPAARQLRDELRAVCAALEQIQPEEPPADLRERILAALPTGQATGAPAAGFPATSGCVAGRSALRSSFRRRLAGQRAGIPVRHLAGLGRASVNQLVGTMARAVPESVDVQGGGSLVDKATIEMPQVTGAVSLHGTPAAPVVGVSVRARTDIDVVARLEGQAISFSGFDTAATRTRRAGRRVRA